MRELLLVCASGLAREVLASEELLERYETVTVLDDDPATWGSRLHGRTVVGGVGLVAEHPDHELLLCAGNGAVRRALVHRLARLGVGPERYATSIHPDVRVPRSCQVGRGSVLLAGSVLTADVRIGDHVVVMPHATLTHDDVVEDFATLCAGATLGGGVRVGSGAYLGMGAAVREGVRVGRDAVLGMGAVLTTDLPPSQIWVGVPAQEMRVRLEVER